MTKPSHPTDQKPHVIRRTEIPPSTSWWTKYAAPETSREDFDRAVEARVKEAGWRYEPDRTSAVMRRDF